MSCGVGQMWLGSHRLAATAPIGPLAWEPPHAAGVALKRPKKKKNESEFHIREDIPDLNTAHFVSISCSVDLYTSSSDAIPGNGHDGSELVGRRGDQQLYDPQINVVYRGKPERPEKPEFSSKGGV